ncbi:MAG: PEP-CTERM sorting domain-containing protein [Bryobacterales bacterium]|nr:PEP-CTERM sorting domain-containing protein [Bryobacterales bacterium]
MVALFSAASYGATYDFSGATGSGCGANPTACVYSTGVNNSNVLLSDGTSDGHYSLVGVPSGSGLGPSTYVVMSNQFPLSTGSWFANDSSSKWIAPDANQNQSMPQSDSEAYIYRMTFNLSLLGLSSGSYTINLGWLSDNNRNSTNTLTSQILLNGTPVPSSGNSGQSAGGLTPVTINGTYSGGTVNLDFVVYNLVYNGPGNNPTGLRVNITGATASDNEGEVPEPATFSLLAAGLIGIGLFTRRK